jgi:hypothetical protein
VNWAFGKLSSRELFFNESNAGVEGQQFAPVAGKMRGGQKPERDGNPGPDRDQTRDDGEAPVGSVS